MMELWGKWVRVKVVIHRSWSAGLMILHRALHPGKWPSLVIYPEGREREREREREEEGGGEIISMS